MGWIAAVGERGQTITQPPGGGGGITYGPVAGDVAVRNGTAPLAVAHPGGSPTVVNPGDSIASKITTAGDNGRLWFVKGSHLLTGTVSPLPGQKWYLESIAGYTRTTADSAILDWQDSNVDQGVFAGSDDVNFEIHGGVLRRVGNSSGSVNVVGVLLGGNNSLIEDVIIKDNFNNGLHLTGASVTVRRCYITNNGRQGFSAANVGKLTKCRLSFNNTRLLEIGAIGSSAGTMKVSGSSTSGFTWTDNWIHDNLGYGIWNDTPNAAGSYNATGNVIEHNSRAGIFYEGPTGGSVIFRNYLLNNGYDTQSIGGVAPDFWNDCQLQITNSDQSLGNGVRGQVSRNIFDYTLSQSEAHGGLMALWQHAVHPGRTNRWDVLENQWWFRSATSWTWGRLNMTDSATTGALLGSADLTFTDNEYHVASTATENWMEVEPGTRTEDRLSYSQWQARFSTDDIGLVLI